MLTPHPFILEIVCVENVYVSTRVVVFDIDEDTEARSVLDIIEANDAQSALIYLLGRVEYSDLCVQRAASVLFQLSPPLKTRHRQAKQLYDLWCRLHPDTKVPYRV